MKDMLYNTIRPIRSWVMKMILPRNRYFLFPTRSTQPISTKFGFDRGTPIDRSYIERFIGENARYIKGICLEIHNSYYTTKYGGTRVTKNDVLDIDTNNKRASLYGDLRNIPSISNATYDCIILTHTLGVINDHEAAVRECLRILKPGGVILVTVSAMGVAQEPTKCFWRYTPAGLKYLFEKHLSDGYVDTFSYGNVLAGQAFWVGLAAEELTTDELLYNDPRYAVISVGVIRKT